MIQTIKPSRYAIPKEYMDNIPTVWLTDKTPDLLTLEKLTPNGLPRIVFIPYEGWPCRILQRFFSDSRERFHSMSIRREDFTVSFPQVISGWTNRAIGKAIGTEYPMDDSHENDAQIKVAFETIRESLDRPAEICESSPIVELVPWRYCKFVLINKGRETLIDLDGTLIVPIFGGKLDDLQKLLISSVFKRYWLSFLKERGVYPDKIDPSITIGLDPEISVYRTVSGKSRINEHITASDIIGNRNCQLRVGTDGCDSIFEFRPEASAVISKVVDSVENCFKVLAYKLARKGITDAFALVGGGCGHSIGGHIHIGNSRIKKLSNADLEMFGKMLDDFLYNPIRDRMTGAIRQWINLPTCSQQTFAGPISTFTSIEDAKHSLKDVVRFNRGVKFVGYDNPSQFRQKNYGYEYRSLPSFIVNREFTETVLTMVQIISKFFYDLCDNGDEFKYTSPPSMSEYKRLFPVELAKTFFRYINGDMREVFMDNAFDSWKISVPVYKKFIQITLASGMGAYGERGSVDSDDLSEIGEAMTKRFHSILNSVFATEFECPKFTARSANVIGSSFSIQNREYRIDRPSLAKLVYNMNDGIVNQATLGGGVYITHGSGLRKNGILHCCKQAFIMSLYRAIGKSQPEKYKRFCGIIRAWMKETESTYGPIITDDFGPSIRPTTEA